MRSDNWEHKLQEYIDKYSLAHMIVAPLQLNGKKFLQENQHFQSLIEHSKALNKVKKY